LFFHDIIEIEKPHEGEEKFEKDGEEEIEINDKTGEGKRVSRITKVIFFILSAILLTSFVFNINYFFIDKPNMSDIFSRYV